MIKLIMFACISIFCFTVTWGVFEIAERSGLVERSRKRNLENCRFYLEQEQKKLTAREGF